MNAKEIVRALETEVLCENCPHNESNCPDDGCYYIMAAALIDKLQALAENGQSAIDTNMRLVKVVESLQAQLAASQRREKAASSFIAKNCPQCEPVEGGIPYCSNYNIACDGCEHIWRGPQEAGKGDGRE